MWYELFFNVMNNCICDADILDYVGEDDLYLNFQVYNTAIVMPTIIFQSFIVVNLTYRALFNTWEFWGKKSSDRMEYDRSACSSFIDFDDDNELFYCQNDLNYVIDLLNKNSGLEEHKHEAKCHEKKSALSRQNQISPKTIEVQPPDSNVNEDKDFNVTIHGTENIVDDIKDHNAKSDKKQANLKTKSFLRKHIYDPQPIFKFSSRFVNCQVVAIVTLYHCFLLYLYLLVYLALQVDKLVPDSLFDNTDIVVDPQQIICELGPDFCIPQLENVQALSFTIPASVRTNAPRIKHALTTALITSTVLALVICIVQILFGMLDFRTHLMQLYKGKCEYLPVRSTLTNVSITGQFLLFTRLKLQRFKVKLTNKTCL
jgi:hypothetical protein